MAEEQKTEESRPLPLTTMSTRILIDSLPAMSTRFFDIAAVLLPTILFASRGEEQAAAAQLMDISLVAIVCLRQYGLALNVYLPRCVDKPDEIQAYYASASRYAMKASAFGSAFLYLTNYLLGSYATDSELAKQSIYHFAAFAGLAPLFLLHARNDQQTLLSVGHRSFPLFVSMSSFAAVCALAFPLYFAELESEQFALGMGGAYLFGAIVKFVINKLYFMIQNPLQIDINDRSLFKRGQLLLKNSSEKHPLQANKLYKIGRFIVAQIFLETFVPIIQTLFVTSLGDESLATLKYVSTIFTLTLVTLLGFGNGLTLAVNRALGKNQRATNDDREQEICPVNVFTCKNAFALTLITIGSVFYPLFYAYHVITNKVTHRYEVEQLETSLESGSGAREMAPISTLSSPTAASRSQDDTSPVAETTRVNARGFSDAEFAQARRIIWTGAGMVSFFTFCVSLVAIAAPDKLLGLMIEDQAVIESNLTAMQITGAWMLTAMPGHGLANGMRGVGENRSSAELRVYWDWLLGNFILTPILVYATPKTIESVLIGNAVTSLLFSTHLGKRFADYTYEKAVIALAHR